MVGFTLVAKSKRIGFNKNESPDYDHRTYVNLFENNNGVSCFVDTPAYVGDFGTAVGAPTVGLNGYPILPSGRSAICRFHVLDDVNDESPLLPGTWSVLWDGGGVTGRVMAILDDADSTRNYIDATSSGYTFPWTPSAALASLACIVSHDPGNPISNVRFVHSSVLLTHLLQPFRQSVIDKYGVGSSARWLGDQRINGTNVEGCRWGGAWPYECSVVIHHPVADGTPHRRWFATGDTGTEVRPVADMAIVGLTSGATGILKTWDNYRPAYNGTVMHARIKPTMGGASGYPTVKFLAGETLQLANGTQAIIESDSYSIYNSEETLSVLYTDHTINQSHVNRTCTSALDIAIIWANCTRQDLHWMIPHGASDEYVTAVAAYIAARLRKGIRWILEFSNEVWNDLFMQRLHSRGTGVDDSLAGGNEYEQGATWYARRSTEVWALARAQFSDPTQVVRAFAWQHYGISGATAALGRAAPAGGVCSDYTDIIYTADYWQGDQSASTTLAQCKTAALVDIAAAKTQADGYMALAVSLGVAYGRYEGGPSDVIYDLTTPGDALMKSFHFSSQMGDCITQYCADVKTNTRDKGSATAIHQVRGSLTYFHDFGRVKTRAETFGGANYWPSQRKVDDSPEAKLAALLAAIATDQGAAPAHTSFTAIHSGTSIINLAWTLGAAGLATQIWRSTSGTIGTYDLIAVTAANAVSYSDTGRATGTRYWYLCESMSTHGMGVPATADDTTASSSPPGVPSIVVAAIAPSGGNTPIRITVTPGTGAVTTNLEKSLDNFATAATELAADMSGIYNDTTAAGNTVAYYRSHSVNPDGTSAYCTVGSALAYPKKPTLAMAQLTATSNRGVCTAGAGGAASFKLRRSADGAGTFSQVAAGAGPNLDDTTAVEGVPVDYEARSVNASGDSESSLTQDVTTKPATITGLVAVPLPGKVGVSWTNPSTHSSTQAAYIADISTGPWTLFDYFPPDVLSFEYSSPTDLPDVKFFSVINITADGTLSARSNVDSAAPLPHDGGSEQDPDERFMFVSQEHFPRMFAASVRTGKFKAHPGAELLRVGTVVAFDTSTTPGMWVPWTEGGSNGGNIPRAIVMPDPIQLKTGNEVLADIMVVGVIHVDDLIDHANQSSSQALRDALISSSDILRKNKIIVRGLPGVR